MFPAIDLIFIFGNTVVTVIGITVSTTPSRQSRGMKRAKNFHVHPLFIGCDLHAVDDPLHTSDVHLSAIYLKSRVFFEKVPPC